MRKIDEEENHCGLLNFPLNRMKEPTHHNKSEKCLTYTEKPEKNANFTRKKLFESENMIEDYL